MFQRLFFLFLLFLYGLLYAQDGFEGMIGSYSDMRFVPPQTKQKNEFSFARLVYNGRMHTNLKNWYTDYPQGDKQIVAVVKRLTNIDIAGEERVVPINSPDLFNYPMIYSSEAGQMVLDDIDVSRLKEYFLRGGFWMIDDFWGSWEWNIFEKEIKKIFPEQIIVDIPLEHPIFHTVFDIKNIIQVPNVGYAYTFNAVTWEEDGITPEVKGIFDEHGQLIVVMYFNTDIMDAAEWADDPNYPHRFSSYAYKIFINTIAYAMTH